MNKKLISDAFHSSNYYYDLLYRDKNYKKEADYVAGLIKFINPEATELIELGVGTGSHSEFLCHSGFRITGIEQNEQMAAIAASKSIDGFSAIVDDIVEFEIPGKFDAAISLFHVISYLTENDKIVSCFKQVSKHLKEQGIFVFDVWYTPAVYSQLPQIRIKHIEDDHLDITRVAEPIINYENNIVEVHYEITIKNKRNKEREVLKEVHYLRHLGTPEIKLFAEVSGFRLLRSEEFLTSKVPGADTWGVCYILQKHD